MKTFGANLKELRIQCGLTQKDFANKMQTTQQRVSEWETNKVEPTLYNIIRITKILDVSFEELIEGITDTI
jgi:transcriptional regulator with XRE-family HTH domain